MSSPPVVVSTLNPAIRLPPVTIGAVDRASLARGVGGGTRVRAARVRIRGSTGGPVCSGRHSIPPSRPSLPFHHLPSPRPAPSPPPLLSSPHLVLLLFQHLLLLVYLHFLPFTPLAIEARRPGRRHGQHTYLLTGGGRDDRHDQQDERRQGLRVPAPNRGRWRRRPVAVDAADPLLHRGRHSARTLDGLRASCLGERDHRGGRGDRGSTQETHRGGRASDDRGAARSPIPHLRPARGRQASTRRSPATT